MDNQQNKKFATGGIIPTKGIKLFFDPPEEILPLSDDLDIGGRIAVVVRCKECKHRYYNEYMKTYCCEMWADGFDTAVREDEYCSRGERKSDGKE